MIQMIANASLDAIEEVMRKDSVMFVPSLCSTTPPSYAPRCAPRSSAQVPEIRRQVQRVDRVRVCDARKYACFAD